ncbi:exonuclease subunit SbcD [Shewanella maritima]|uniref:exonuclease subunit SbcD n=1 Tax=Shewanella maritima TaxID=2520507 RepID=UPI003736A330
MRVLHTSDWHLGQYFYGKSRADEHQHFMNWLLNTIKANQVQLLIVAGDIFDTGTPPSYARALYNQFIVDMQQTGCELLILGGNHDSVSTLAESQALLSYLNTHVVPGGFSEPEQHVLTMGMESQPQALVCALPFLRARDLISSEAGESGVDKQHKLSLAIAHYYQHCFDHALKLKQQILAEQGVSVPIIATGHLTTVGASSSESVRDIYIGSLDAFNAAHFPAADYIALGHIHRMQIVAKSEHIRYCGSPIPLSFDELPADQLQSGKHVLLVEFEQDKLKQVQPIAIPLFQPMRAIKGNLQEIEQLVEELVKQLIGQLAMQSDANETNQQPLNTWLSVEVVEQDYLTDLQGRIAKIVADKPVEVLQLTRARKQRHSANPSHNETLAEINVADVFERRLALESFETEQEQARRERVSLQFKRIAQQVESQLNHEQHPDLTELQERVKS